MGAKNKQDIIYNAGIKLFGKYGVKRVSVDMLVKEAGIAKGTFYLYYKNKELLYEHIMEDILNHGTIFLNNLVQKIPDVKERFYFYMIRSLWFFQKNEIVKNLIKGNTDYYIGKINDDYLKNKHIALMKILLGNEFQDEKFVEFVANTKGFFANVINYKSCFASQKEFEEFVMNLASVLVNGLFSDYSTMRKGKSFQSITSGVPKIKK